MPVLGIEAWRMPNCLSCNSSRKDDRNETRLTFQFVASVRQASVR